MRNDLVSIIIPYFRKRDFFAKTIKSVNEQTYQNKEIIVIYDDNDHKDLSFVREIIKKNKKSRLIINKKNLGVGKSRNKGIIKSKGKYIAFLDRDDFWSKNKLKDQINFMKKNNLSFSHSSYNIINSEGKKTGKYMVKKNLYYTDLIKSCDIGLSTVILEKKILGKNKFCDLKTKEDYYLWLKLVKKLKVLNGTGKYLTNWRSLRKSLSSSKTQRLMDAYRLYNNFENYNGLLSIYYVLRLSIYSLIKKYKIYF